MRTAVFMIANSILFIICYGYPFVATLRGSKADRTVPISGMLFVIFIAFLINLPIITDFFDHALSKQMIAENWVPDVPALVPVVLLGMLPALISVAAAKFVLRIRDRMWPVIPQPVQPIEPQDQKNEEQ